MSFLFVNVINSADLYLFGYNFNKNNKFYTRFDILFENNMYFCTR